MWTKIAFWVFAIGSISAAIAGYMPVAAGFAILLLAVTPFSPVSWAKPKTKAEQKKDIQDAVKLALSFAICGGAALAIDGGHWILGPISAGVGLWALWIFQAWPANFVTWESNCCEKCCIGQHRIIWRHRPWPYEEEDSTDYGMEAAMPGDVILCHKCRSVSTKSESTAQKTGGAQP